MEELEEFTIRSLDPTKIARFAEIAEKCHLSEEEREHLFYNLYKKGEFNYATN